MRRKSAQQVLVRSRDDRVEYNRHCAVAIPVKDEAARLPRCLRALASQRDKLERSLPAESFRVVIYANNCTDNSAKVARSMSAHLSLPALVVEASLPPAEAHAGNARRAAMDIAETWLAERGPNGVLLTTDADSEVPPDWIANNLSAVDSGADAVLGRIALDEEGVLLPDALHRRGDLEGAYETLLTELSSVLDPIACNPWPHHATISGASLAVTLEAYRRVGRLPRVPLGEDKALVAELLRHDARIRFSSDILVVTSGRVNGRAPGGVADTLRFRSREPEAYCDDALEPFHTAITRARSRRWLRFLRQSGALSDTGEWRVFLGVSRECARQVLRAATFGGAWSIVEAGSSLLQRRLLRPADLPDAIAGARRALLRLREQELPARENVEPKRLVPVLSNDLGDRIREIDEEFGRLVTA
jgi:cellulose synthase/poly-beta-1,6-N-acetylglucosamine synthase-like glycosyltransferase